MNHYTENRISHFVDKVLWSMLAGSVLMGVNQLKDISTTISTLNERMAVVVERVGNHEKRLDTLEHR